MRKHHRRWWAAWSSKPVRGVRNFPGGFDSHVLPPFYNCLPLKQFLSSSLMQCHSLWPNTISDFGDALVASAGMASKGAVIVTFDLKFKSALKALGQAVYQP